MKFTHKFTPTAPIKKFSLRVPMPGKVVYWFFKEVVVRVNEGEKVLFELNLLSFKNRINFKIPKGIELAIGKTYYLEIESNNHGKKI